MYLYVELWRPRAAWLDLPRGEREAWFGRLLAALQEQLEGGVEPVGFARPDADAPLDAGYAFVGVWRMPDRAAAERFERFVEDAGWHEYFEQVNARGPAIEIDDFAASHTAIER